MAGHLARELPWRRSGTGLARYRLDHGLLPHGLHDHGWQAHNAGDGFPWGHALGVVRELQGDFDELWKLICLFPLIHPIPLPGVPELGLEFTDVLGQNQRVLLLIVIRVEQQGGLAEDQLFVAHAAGLQGEGEAPDIEIAELATARE